MNKLPQQPSIHWRERPHQRIRTTAEIIDCSEAFVYGLMKNGVLSGSVVAGLTVVLTESIIALLDSRQPWAPGSGKNKAANAARSAQKDRVRSVGRARS